MSKPRLRFAPSPTGYLHIGGARTALFNWLWARKTGGTFILRVEDTDQSRSTLDSVETIFQSMRWLGLDWDEGPARPDDTAGGPHAPYFQMQRLPTYLAHAERLIASGHAYRCYCTKEDIDALKAKLPEKQRNQFRYPGTCRDRRDQPDKPHVVRFRSPADGETVFHDKVFGEVRTPNNAQLDFVLLRTDGVPLYNFGAVVDDVTMGITLVARGRDHIVNTPPQVLLYDALEYPIPEFAHLPMMMANKNDKLSKRHGSVSVTEYRDRGWLPEGLLSYLVRFGWSHGDEEIFTREMLVERFDWEHVGRSDGIFDPKKCSAINQKFMARFPSNDDLAAKLAPFLVRLGIDIATVDAARLQTIVGVFKPRAATLEDIAKAAVPYLRPSVTLDPAAVANALTLAAKPYIDALLTTSTSLGGEWSGKRLGEAFESVLTANGWDMKTAGQPLRVALTGSTSSPSHWDVCEILGREWTEARLASAAASIAHGPTQTESAT